MKRGLAGRTRRGSPPLPRQRKALRVTQASLLGLAAFVISLLIRGAAEGAGAAQHAILAILAFFLLVGAWWMGLARVRGPRPPELE